MNAEKALIFDWGGVLMRTEDYTPRHRWDRRLGLAPGAVERVVHGIPAWHAAQKGEVGLEAYWEAVAAALKLSVDQVAQLARDFYRGDRLDELLVSHIRAWRTQGVRVGLLSNNTLDLNDTLAALALTDLFEVCVLSAAIGVMKPDPAAYQAILQRMYLPAPAALLIDDMPSNVAGARAVGMAGLHFRPGADWHGAIQAWLKGVAA